MSKSRLLGTIWITFLFIFSIMHPASSANAATVGVVLMHGKQATFPFSHISDLRTNLLNSGYLVARPEMPWSGNRVYDTPYLGAMNQISTVVDNLRSQGATSIIIAGHSMGANAALGYAARNSDNIDGIMMLATGHYPELLFNRPTVKESVQRAKAYVDAGSGGTFDDFIDVNMGVEFTINTTAQSYLSYFGRFGPAVIPDNASAIPSDNPMPILWVNGESDPLSKPSSYAFDLAPFHPLSQFTTVDAGHLDTPTAAWSVIDPWIQEVTISAVPLPGAVWLFGSGLLGLIGISRRKKSA
jgi:pimeloyl-ACP methyl ester carboxylesterase